MVALACGPAALPELGTTPTLTLGESRRAVETLTDLEEVRDIAILRDEIYIATDRGLFRFFSSGQAPGERVDELPSDDVRALIADEGSLMVVTAAGPFRLAGDTLTPLDGVANLGPVMDAARTVDGTLWLCGLGGLARLGASGWEHFGEPIRCTTLAPTPEGQLWVGTTAGLLRVEGDVIREHPISGGIPEGYVRAVVPVLPGQAMALLDGANASSIGHWDGERWHAYTIRGLSGRVVGLVQRGPEVLLVAEEGVIAIAPRGRGVELVPLSSTPGTVQGYRARITPLAEHRPGDLPSVDDLLKEPLRLVPVPDVPAPSAPTLVARALDLELPGRAYAGFAEGNAAFIAIANRGVLRVPAEGTPRLLSTGSLVPEQDLQLANDRAGALWALSRENELAKRVNGRLRRVPPPDGLVAQALASGSDGAYLAALDPSAPNTVRVYRNAGRGWSLLAERPLELSTALVRVPFLGVAPDGRVWLGLEVQREDGAGRRTRGVAVIDASSETVLYHHRGAERERGELAIPDEVSTIDFDGEGNAWLASFSGLIRMDAHQAVVFGASRGVRGEIVSDAVAGEGVVWLASMNGIASYDRTSFDFDQPPEVQRARPLRLAIDPRGHLWAASPRGLLHRDGAGWSILGADEGLPSTELKDVEVDADGNVWLLAEDRVLVLSR